MKTIIVRCRSCKHEFRATVLDSNEARDPRRHAVPLKCPRCGSQDIDT